MKVNPNHNSYVESKQDPKEKELVDLISRKLSRLRPKLLDLTKKNPLISTRFSDRSNSHIRVVDEIPEVLLFNLLNEKKMRLISLPPLDDEPLDEQTKEFKKSLANAKLTDKEYQNAIKLNESNGQQNISADFEIERALKDRLRIALGMLPRQTGSSISVATHAKNNGINPSFDLPFPEKNHQSERHLDADIQTLMLPKDLERRMNGILTKSRSWTQETGISVLHAAFGFLEWSDATTKDKSLAPLLLIPIEIERIKSEKGFEFQVRGVGEQPELNLVLKEKLSNEFGIKIPTYIHSQFPSIESYFESVNNISPVKLRWAVRRQIALGIFPSMRMAMYQDLDPKSNVFLNNNVVATIFAGSSQGVASPFGDEYEVDHPDIEKKVPLVVLDADSSQFSTLVDVADGKNIAVEGPPGSGKSQTIVNAIAAALNCGKKVLFVSEKMAALEVVKARLEAVGLGEFLLALQAERSNRDKVIDSLKKRIDLQQIKSPVEFYEKIEKLKKIRSEIGKYISILSGKFENTDMTVHHILGKSIASAPYLEGKPKAIQIPHSVDYQDLNRSRIDYICNIGDEFSKLWQQRETVAQFWKGHKLTAINRFVLDEIETLTLRTAASFRESAAIRKSLVTYDISENISYDELLQALSICRQIKPKLKILKFPLIKEILKRNLSDDIKKFAYACDSYQAEIQKYFQLFNNDDISTWIRDLKLINRCCIETGIESLDLDTLNGILNDASKMNEDLGRVKFQLNNIFKNHPECLKHPFQKLINAKNLLNSTSRQSLLMRSNIYSQPSTLVILENSIRIGTKINSEKIELEKFVNTSDLTSVSVLQDDLENFRSSGFFRFLSSKYRKSKRRFRSISRRKKFKVQLAMDDLINLIKFKEDASKYLADNSTKEAFGQYYFGLDTDFEAFAQLAKFYHCVDGDFGSAVDSDLKKFLSSESVELLTSDLDLELLTSYQNFEILKQKIDENISRIHATNSAIEMLRPVICNLRDPVKMKVDSIDELTSSIEECLRQKDELDSNVEIEALLGEIFQGALTETSIYSEEIDVASLLSQLTMASELLVQLSQGSTDIFLAQLEKVAEFEEVSKSALAALCERTKLDKNRFLIGCSGDDIVSYLELAARDREGFEFYSNIAKIENEIQSLGFSWVMAELGDCNEGLDVLGKVFEGVIFRALAMEVYRHNGLSNFLYRGNEVDSRRLQFAELDREITKLSAMQLKSKLISSARPPKGNGVGKKSEWTEMSLINNEIAKKQRFISVRDLTHRARKSLLELKPCWMMSPLAVAQYLARECEIFDLCIIDEASQMPPQDAIGSILRSRQVMVVGDTNQLPPTNFYKTLIEDDDEVEDDEIVSEESILEMANAVFRPARRLRWHYRSKHSSLIKFSNHMVYDDDLVIFPSPDENRSDMGVKLVAVPGIYKASTNPEEASAIVDAALDFMKRNASRSLGIVTMNQKQRDLIKEGIDYALTTDQEAQKYVDFWKSNKGGLEEFFVKNIENVQGDERDVIFIGTVYGPEVIGGPVMHRFGPINGSAGKRRLNVLFSRAKMQIVTFSSMTSDDIKADGSNPGVYMLKRWLEYSASGLLKKEHRDLGSADSDFEEYVKKQVEAMGCEVTSNVGVTGFFIDIGVKHPEWPYGYIMGIECDGASYHSSRSARDRDRLRQQILEGLGWNIYRVWSTDWFNDPVKEGEKIRAAIEARMLELSKDKHKYGTSHSEKKLDGKIDFESMRKFVSEHKASFPLSNEASKEQFDDRIKTIGDPIPDNSKAKFIDIGDKIRIEYLTGTKKTHDFTLNDEVNDPSSGLVSSESPLGQAILGYEEGDEVEILVDNYLRRAKIVSVTKK